MASEAGGQEQALSSSELDFSAIDAAAVSIIGDWLKGDVSRERAAGSYYLTKLSGGHLFEAADLEIARYCRRQFDPGTACFELGVGFGELSLLLSLSGYQVIGYESDLARHAGALALVDGFSARGVDVGNLTLVPGMFPDAVELDAFDSKRPSVFVSTNVTSTHVMDKFVAIQRAWRLFDHLVMDLSRLGVVRDQLAKEKLVAELRQAGFAEVARVYQRGDTDVRHFARSAAAPAAAAAPEAVAQVVRLPRIEPVAAGAVAPGQPAFDPFTAFEPYFSLAGSIRLSACPVCESGRITEIWRFPQSRLKGHTYLSAPGEAHHNTYLDYLPLLKVPQEIFTFDICADCHSIFRNPKDDDQGVYKRDTSKVESFKRQGLDPFRGTAATCEALFPPNTRFVVDAACGSGQVLAIYKEKRPDLRLFGLELSEPSVEWIKGLGIEAAVTDLDHDDLDVHVAPGTVDFIVFNEAFEHVRSPLHVLRKMFRMLRPGGRIHFTAQYFGPENALQIRVGEPIYIDRHGLDWVIAQLNGELVELKADIKYRVTLAKKS